MRPGKIAVMEYSKEPREQFGNSGHSKNGRKMNRPQFCWRRFLNSKLFKSKEMHLIVPAKPCYIRDSRLSNPDVLMCLGSGS